MTLISIDFMDLSDLMDSFQFKGSINSMDLLIPLSIDCNFVDFNGPPDSELIDICGFLDFIDLD